MKRWRKPGDNAPKADTERLLDLWHSGYTTRQMADDLGMSPGNLRNRVTLLRKRGADLPYRVKRRAV